MSEIYNYTCIVCPQSCDLVLTAEADGQFNVSGNRCKRGISYAKDEHTNPMRMITTTVSTESSPLRRLPVISSGPVPKAKLFDCLKEIYTCTATAPIKMGDVLISNIQNTGINIQASRNLPIYG